MYITCVYLHTYIYIPTCTYMQACIHAYNWKQLLLLLPLTNGVWSMDKAIHAVVEFIASPSIECVLPVAAAMICYCPPSTVACHLALRVIWRCNVILRYKSFDVACHLTFRVISRFMSSGVGCHLALQSSAVICHHRNTMLYPRFDLPRFRSGTGTIRAKCI